MQAHHAPTLYRWEQFHGKLPANTVYASPEYAVIRAHHGSDWIVGKYATGGHKAYIPWGGKETEVGTFEVLVHAPGTKVQWVPASHGQIHNGAIGPVGNDQLYVGRVVCPQPESKYTPGKIHPAHKCLYIPWGGQEHKNDNYECLTIVSEWSHYTNTVYNWEKFHGHLPANTVYADPAYAVIRAHHGSDWIVGKYSTGGRKAYIPWGGAETEIPGEFEVLVSAPGTTVQWVPCHGGQIPEASVGPVGNDQLFVGRVVCPQPENKYTPGKIHPAHKCLYIPWGGKEHKSENYEALTIRWTW